MKKTVILIALLAFLLAGCRTVSLSGSSGQITYHHGDISVSEELTAEELALVTQILDGKALRSEKIYGMPGCGFVPEISITVDDTVYMMALDTCGVLMIEGSGDYVQISDEERAELEQLFNDRGGSFPCY